LKNKSVAMRLMKYWFLEESFNMLHRVGRTTMMKLCDLLEMKVYAKGDKIHESFDGEHLMARVIFLEKQK